MSVPGQVFYDAELVRDGQRSTGVVTGDHANGDTGALATLNGALHFRARGIDDGCNSAINKLLRDI